MAALSVHIEMHLHMSWASITSLVLCLARPSAVAAADAPWIPDRKPLRPALEPDSGHPVNRDRIYDFYAKQAFAFGMAPSDQPLPPFPGLDGGAHGHQGNQNDLETWMDNRWSLSPKGDLFSGVLRTGDVLAPKAVWVRAGERCGAFDPETLRIVLEWRGKLVRIGPRRRGFIESPTPGGEVTRKATAPSAKGTYRGFYRHGSRVIFSYEREGKEWLETLADGAKPRGALDHLTRGGPTRWPGWITTPGRLGKGSGHLVDTVELPFRNPHGTLFFLSGLDFLPDGTGVVATMPGEVWLVRGLEGDLREVRWKRYATGLHQPLGVRVVDGRIHVVGRDQVTRLDDLNGDDEADFHACVAAGQATSPNVHDYVIGLEVDHQGRFLTTSGNQGVIRLTPGATQAEVLATGIRNPNGIGMSPDGRFVTTSFQEGNWTPSSGIVQLDLSRPGRPHFGNNGAVDGRIDPPLIRLPRGEDNSSASQIFLGPKGWPELAGDGNLLHLSYGMGNVWMVTRQQVGEVWQGAALRLTGSLKSGAQQARFHPRDGQLWVVGLSGWQSYTTDDGCLHRIRPSVKVPVLIAHEIRGNGVLLRANLPLPSRASQPSAAFAQCWNYVAPSPAYGSPELSVRQPEKAGHDRLEIRSVTILEDGRTVFLEIPELARCDQLHLRLPWEGAHDADIFLTVHALAEDFTGIPGYRAVPRDHTDHAPATPAAGAPALVPVSWEEELCGLPSRELRIEAVAGLRFSEEELRARAGERLRLTFANPDSMPHNWVLVETGAADTVAVAAGKLAERTDGFSRHYAHEVPGVLCHTRVVLPGASSTIWFPAPAKPGRYPYLCTIPGHAQVMRGVLVVE